MSKYVEGINEERFDAFLADLRSGKLLQGTGSLHTIDRNEEAPIEKFCCLGVACIRPAAEGIVKKNDDPGFGFSYVKYDGQNTTDLPTVVADYLGIPQKNRVDAHGGSSDVAFFKMGYDIETHAGRMFTAVGLNDRLGKTFNQIADAFEQEFLKEA